MNLNYAIGNECMQITDAHLTGKPVIDKEALLGLYADLDEDEELLQEMVTLFLEDAAMQLMNARRVLADQDIASLKRIAHTLKGSSSYYGATRLGIPSRELEEHCEQGNLSVADALLTQMDKEYQAVKVVLKAMVFEQAPGNFTTLNQSNTHSDLTAA
jgi:HPt (histidine-containing phosphotransfer) domain-containing protein